MTDRFNTTKEDFTIGHYRTNWNYLILSMTGMKKHNIQSNDQLDEIYNKLLHDADKWNNEIGCRGMSGSGKSSLVYLEEIKQLKENIKLELDNSADLTRRMNKYYSESKNLKEKLQKIQTELDKKYHYGVAESIRKILREES